MKHRITVDFDLCESFGVCVAAAPQFFDLDDDDNLLVLSESPTPQQLASVRDAITRCPKKAIALDAVDGG